jgi:hypothetical protein
MKSLVSVLAVLVSCVVSTNVFAMDSFPKGPDATLTPGAVCTHPDAKRYPEQINYCNRNVDSATKRDVFIKYDQMGYRTGQMDRSKFKIDHYISLCMGGGNDEANLWPQHESVYTITDPLEAALCEKMAEGKLLQKDAIALIKQGKANLDQVPAILQQVNRM